MPLPAAAQAKVDRAQALLQSNLPGAADEAAKAKEELAAKEAELAKAKEALALAEHRAAVLKGKYDAEVPALAAKVKTLEDQAKQAAEDVERKPGEVKSLNAEEQDLLGQPMIQANVKIAQEVAERAVQAALKPLLERQNEFEQMTKDAYFATIDGILFPDWDTKLKDDPKLILWLNQLDPGTKQIRGALLKRAENGLQGYRVAEILSAFLEGREIGVREAPKPKEPPLSPPAGGNSPSPNPDPGKKTFTRGEIAAFYRVKRTAPEYQGPEGVKRARAMEVEIAAASREGRVTP